MSVGRSFKVVRQPKSAFDFSNIIKHMDLLSSQVYDFQLAKYLHCNCFQFLEVVLQIVARNPWISYTARLKHRIVNKVRIHCIKRCSLLLNSVSSLRVDIGCSEWKYHFNTSVVPTFKHSLHTSWEKTVELCWHWSGGKIDLEVLRHEIVLIHGKKVIRCVQ